MDQGSVSGADLTFVLNGFFIYSKSDFFCLLRSDHCKVNPETHNCGGTQLALKAVIVGLQSNLT